jgi:hypothetical protein
VRRSRSAESCGESSVLRMLPALPAACLICPRQKTLQKPFDSRRTFEIEAPTSTAALLVRAGLAVVSSPPDGDVVDFDLVSVGVGEDVSLSLGRDDCCLTIESEEREAWTADVLADGAFGLCRGETL